MTRTALLLSPPIFKEVRALALPWLACVVVMIAPAIVDRRLSGIAVSVYFLGAAALGALSMGHEYTDRTLALLLSLPARRERLFLIKFGALAAMLLTLGVLADMLVFRDARISQPWKQAVVLLPVLCGLCVTPWLTMACRSPVAGTVFTLPIPGILLVVGELLGELKYGRGREMDAFTMALVWRGTLALCAIGSVASWWMFMRLEAIEGPDRDMRLPKWLRRRTTASAAAPPFTKRHPVWLLVNKELHLQQMTFVVAGLYVLGWIAVASVRLLVPAADDAFTALAGLLALLVGSFASAGERQLGTLEWQVLLPIAVSKQWAVKVGVVLGLALLLGLGLPAALSYLTPGTNPKQVLRPEFAIAVIMLTAGCLYVSSLCASGLWALMMSLPAMFGAGTFLSFTGDWVGAASYTASSRMFRWMAPPGFGLGWLGLNRLSNVLTVLLVAGFIALVLRFALANHRSADLAAGRVWKQTIVMAAFVTAGIMIFAGAQAFHR